MGSILATLRQTLELNGCYDELIVDLIGNYIFHKKGNGKKILLSCHIDEISFMIRFIDDAGLLHIVPVGYHDDRMVINQDMVMSLEFIN